MPEGLLEPAHLTKKATPRPHPASLFMATRCSGTCAPPPLCCISVEFDAQDDTSSNESVARLELPERGCSVFRFSFFDFRV